MNMILCKYCRYFTCVLLSFAFSSFGRAQERKITNEELELLKEVKVIQVVIEESGYVLYESASHFYDVAKEVLESVDFQAVSSDSMAFDATLTIKSKGSFTRDFGPYYGLHEIEIAFTIKESDFYSSSLSGLSDRAIDSIPVDRSLREAVYNSLFKAPLMEFSLGRLKTRLTDELSKLTQKIISHRSYLVLAPPVKTDTTVSALDSGMGLTILNHAVSALGGLGNFATIKSLKIKSEAITYSNQDSSIKAFSIVIALPDRIRTDLSSMVSGEITTILNGDSLTVSTPDEGEWTLDAPTREKIKENMRSELWHYLPYLFANADSIHVEYFGSYENESQSGKVILITPPMGNDIKLFIESETNLPVRMNYSSIDHFMFDFSDVSGIKLPFKEVLYKDGKKISEYNHSEISINVNVDKMMFQQIK